MSPVLQVVLCFLTCLLLHVCFVQSMRISSNSSLAIDHSGQMTYDGSNKFYIGTWGGGVVSFTSDITSSHAEGSQSLGQSYSVTLSSSAIFYTTATTGEVRTITLSHGTGGPSYTLSEQITFLVCVSDENFVYGTFNTITSYKFTSGTVSWSVGKTGLDIDGPVSVATVKIPTVGSLAIDSANLVYYFVDTNLGLRKYDYVAGNITTLYPVNTSIAPNQIVYYNNYIFFTEANKIRRFDLATRNVYDLITGLSSASALYLSVSNSTFYVVDTNVLIKYKMSCDPISENGTAPLCTCASGYAVSNSLTFTCLPTCNGTIQTNIQVCNGHGTCNGVNNCTCTSGWGGQFCNLPKCNGILVDDPKVCNGQGICISPDKCQCNSTFGGDYCTIPKCDGILQNETATVCNGRGTCVGFNNCTCSPNWGGQFCSLPKCNGIVQSQNNVCNGQGICISPNTCQCNLNFGGEYCTIPKCNGILQNETATVCTGRGFCLSPDNCTCSEGFGGIYCGIPIPFSIVLSSSYASVSVLNKKVSVRVVGTFPNVISYIITCNNCSGAFNSFSSISSLISIDLSSEKVGVYSFSIVALMNNSRISNPSLLIVEIMDLPPISFGFLSLPSVIERGYVFQALASNISLGSLDVVSSMHNCGKLTCPLTLTISFYEKESSSIRFLKSFNQNLLGYTSGTFILFSPLVSISKSLNISPNSTSLLITLSLESTFSGNKVLSNFSIPIVSSVSPPSNNTIIFSPSNGQAISQYFTISSLAWTGPSQLLPLSYAYGIYLEDSQQFVQLTSFDLSTQVSMPLPYLQGGQVSVALFVRNSLGNILKNVIGKVSVTRFNGILNFSNLTTLQLAVSIFDQSSQLSSTDVSSIINQLVIDSNFPDPSLIWLKALSDNNVLNEQSTKTLSEKINSFLNGSFVDYQKERLSLGYVKTKLSDSAMLSSFSIISSISSNASVDPLLASFSQLMVTSSIPKVYDKKTNDFNSVSYSTSSLKASISSFLLLSDDLSSNKMISPNQFSFSATLNFTELSNSDSNKVHSLSIISFSNNTKVDNYSASNQLFGSVTDFKYYQDYQHVKLNNLVNPIILQFISNNSNSLQNVTNSTTINCMFWDETNGKWSKDGCSLIGFDQQSSTIQCGCNHTTSFATFIEYNLSSIATTEQKIQVSNIFYAQIAFGAFFAIITLIVLILLIVFRKHQPVSSRLLTPYLGMIALFVECVSIFIIQRSVLVDYLWNVSSDWSSSNNAPNIIANVTTIIVNTLNVSAIFCYVWQTVRYQLMKYLYDVLSKSSLTDTDNSQSKSLKLLRRFTSKTLFISLILICLFINLFYWTLWVVLVRTEVIPSVVYTQITSISYTVIIFLFSVIITVITIVDVVATFIKEDVYFKTKVNINHKILKDSNASLEMQLTLAPHPPNKFFHSDAPLFFRIEMIAYVICFSLMIVQQVTGLIVYSSGSGADMISQLEIVNLVFQILYYITFIIVFGGFSLIVVLLVFRGKRKITKQEESELLELMNDQQVGLQLFEVFCESEMSIENVYLFEMIKDYQNSSKVISPTFIRTIFELFIDRNSKYEVNIPTNVTKSFKELIQTIDNQNIELEQENTNSSFQKKAAETIEELYIQILMNLEDTFSRFLNSDIYEKYVEKKGWKDKFLSQSNIGLSSQQ